MANSEGPNTRRIRRVFQAVLSTFPWVATLALAIAFLQYRIAEERLSHERSLIADLVYDYDLTLSKADSELLDSDAKDLAEEFFTRLSELSKEKPEAGYPELLRDLLPMRKEVPPRPLVVRALIRNISNNKKATATNVRAVFNLGRSIGSVDVKTGERFQISRGGVGSTDATIEIDRIVAGNAPTITIVSDKLADHEGAGVLAILNPLEDGEQTIPGRMGDAHEAYERALSALRDSLRIREKLQWSNNLQWGNNGETLNGFISRVDVLPMMYYFPPKIAPSVQVVVTADQGAAELVRALLDTVASSATAPRK